MPEPLSPAARQLRFGEGASRMVGIQIQDSKSTRGPGQWNDRAWVHTQPRTLYCGSSRRGDVFGVEEKIEHFDGLHTRKSRTRNED
ncbi:hypothetical protein PM082_011062 [Marasmius tenuissimus]|nr:hypothetical protein PM082_011062 [Marasmius tenuissimus]